jgi:hypothetical protein
MTRIGICQVVACPELEMDVDVGHFDGCEWDRCVRETEIECAYEKKGKD